MKATLIFLATVLFSTAFAGNGSGTMSVINSDQVRELTSNSGLVWYGGETLDAVAFRAALRVDGKWQSKDFRIRKSDLVLDGEFALALSKSAQLRDWTAISIDGKN